MELSSGSQPVFEKIRQLVVALTGAAEERITPQTRFADDLDADSLDLFQIINDIEDTYSITIDETSKISTIGDAVAIVARLLEKKH